MTKLFCDRCGMEIKIGKENGENFPQYAIFRKNSRIDMFGLDLCRTCMKSFDIWFNAFHEEENI